MKIVGIEYTDSQPMLLCMGEDNKIGFYELPKGITRIKPSETEIDFKPINSVRYTTNSNA